MKNPNLIVKLRDSLPPPARNLLDGLLRLTEKRGVQAYLVGGPLRDLLLDRPSLDLDIAVEGDAIALASDLADNMRRDAPQARLGAVATTPRSARPEALVGRAAAPSPEPRAVTHPAFLTATVRIPGFHLDLITARSETYARPGALPTVKPATIREDLLRRDFTINALALRLTGHDAGEILDPSGGLRDLEAHLIRALHERSFQDDATRILRTFRYAARLGFAIESETLAWLKRDLAYLDTISGARIHHEFARILAEDAPEETLRRLREVGALTAIHPALRFEREHAEALTRLRDLHPASARAAYWPVLAWHLTEADAADIARRLALTRSQRAAVEAIPALETLVAQHLQVRPGDFKRSALAEFLDPFPLPALWALASLTGDPTVRDRLLDYLTKARHERPHLTGDDLLALGVPRGPALGDILSRLRHAKLDGEITSRQDEERLARRLITKGDKASHPERKKAPSRSS